MRAVLPHRRFLLPAMLAVVAGAAALTGCDSCNRSSSTQTAPSATAPVASASAPPMMGAAPDASMAGAADAGTSGKMAHCPDAVPGATTTIKDVPGGVELTVASTAPAGVADIQARVQALLDAQKNPSTTVRHSGNGEGGGLLGRCPVVLKNTTITATTSASGSVITVVSKAPDEVDWLRRETRDREEDLEAAGSPAGVGKMSHCPSALLGAITTLKNTPDGVSVTITGPSDDLAKSIRERSQHLAEVANDAGTEPPHSGEGGGHGSIGRCPVVVYGTTLKVKDVPGGSQVDVKAKKAADVPKLQAEAKERAAKFQLPGVDAGPAH